MAIRTTVSSGIDVSDVPQMALSVGQHVNTGATAESAPVLMSVVADNIVTADQFAALVANGSSDLTAPFVARILNAVNETVQDIIDTSTVAPNIDLGWGKFLFEIAGSVATATGTPTAANYCYFSGSVATKYQRAFALKDAYVDTSANPCDLKRIRDAATSALNTINGTAKFYADGRGFTWGTADDKAELYSALGVKVCDLTLNTSDSYANCLSLTIPASASVPVGAYVVRIECAILGKVWRMEQKVNVITAVVPPAPTITCFSTRATGTEDHAYDMATKGYVRGTNLTLGTGGTVTVERKRNGEETWNAVTGVTVNATESTATQIVLDYASSIASMDDQVRVTVVIGGNTVTSNAVTVTDEA